MDRHATGTWFVHGTKHRKENQLQSLKHPCRLSSITNAWKHSKVKSDPLSLSKTRLENTFGNVTYWLVLKTMSHRLKVSVSSGKMSLGVFDIITFTHCGIVYAYIDLGQPWLGWWLVAWRHMNRRWLINRPWGLLAFARGQFFRKCSGNLSLIWVRKWLTYDTVAWPQTISWSWAAQHRLSLWLIKWLI